MLTLDLDSSYSSGMIRKAIVTTANKRQRSLEWRSGLSRFRWRDDKMVLQPVTERAVIHDFVGDMPCQVMMEIPVQPDIRPTDVTVTVVCRAATDEQALAQPDVEDLVIELLGSIQRELLNATWGEDAA